MTDSSAKTIDWTQSVAILGHIRTLGEWSGWGGCRVDRATLARRITAGWPPVRAILLAPTPAERVALPPSRGEAGGPPRPPRQRRRSRGFKRHSRYRGVSLRTDGLWQAQIKVERRVVHLGNYRDELAAARAFDAYVDEMNLGRRKNFE